MTRHLSEDMLDTMARRGIEVNDHVRRCPICRERYSFFVRLYDELRLAQSQPPDARVPLLAGGFRDASVIPLTLYHAPVDPASLSSNNDIVVLAAQTEESGDERFTHVATFASESRGIVMRVTRDARENRYLMNALCDEQSMLGHVVVGISLPPLGEQTLPTDRDGRAIVSFIEECDWKRASVVVALPRARIPLHSAYHRHAVHSRMNATVQLQLGDSSFVIQIRKPKTVRQVIGVFSDGTTEIAAVEECRAGMPLHNGGLPIELRLFW